MKFNHLRIVEYKNLKDVEVDFSTCGRIAVLIGRNGSGKSNFLEAVSLIMNEHVGYKGIDMRLPFYEADFESKGSRFRITRNPHEKRNTVVNSKSIYWGCRQQVIAMYCGEFKRLLECGYKGEEGHCSEPDLTAISIDDYPIALLTMLMADKDSLATVLGMDEGSVACDEVCFKLETPVVDIREEGPQNEFEEIFWQLNGISREADGTRRISFKDFAELIRLGQEPSARTLYWVLSELVNKYRMSHIEDVTISFALTDGARFSSMDLSEGEKRFVLLRATCEYLADDDALLLLDEPDAYINDSRKLDLYDMIKASADRGVMTLMTTHSPLLIDYVPRDQLFVFQKEGERVKVCKGADFDPLVELANSRMAIFSTKPILMVEGKSDLVIIERAIDALGRLHPEKYGAFNLRRAFDVYFMGGAQYAVEQLRLFKEKFPKRRVEFVFDNDKGGRDGCSKLRGETTDLVRTNLLPCPLGLSGDYGVEDYFRKEYLNARINARLESHDYHSFITMPRLRDDLKKELGGVSSIVPPDEEFEGFSLLVDFLMNLQ